MGIYVFGAGEIAKRLVEKIQKYNICIEGFIDNYKKGEYLGYPIRDIEQIDRNSIVIISVLNTNSILNIYRELCQYKIDNIYWYKDFDNYTQASGQTLFLEKECLNMQGWGMLVMPHIELHISDKCNLNCRGCTHFSPLFDEINAVFEEKMNDIKKIKKLFDEVFRIDILGGEPLLNQELSRYVIELRKELPRTFIQIYTNGLLIPKMSDCDLKIIKENNIGISISEYEPTHKIINSIKKTLDRYDISYRIADFDFKQKFNLPISTSERSQYPNLCISNGCITVDKGRISRCPTLMYISKFNDYFGENLPIDGIYNLEEYENGEKLLHDMKKEIPLCKHCIQKEIDWSVCGKEKHFEDFAVRN